MSATMHSVTDDQTGRRTDHIMVPVADHIVYQYDQINDT